MDESIDHEPRALRQLPLGTTFHTPRRPVRWGAYARLAFAVSGLLALAGALHQMH